MEDWIWMPHAGHLCIGSMCKFHLNTYVNGYIVSTVGEYFPDQECRRIYLEARRKYPILDILTGEKVTDEETINKVLKLQGDDFDYAYLHYFGYLEIGSNRLYETMVFEAQKSESKCCPYEMKKDGDDLDMEGYNTAEKAFLGHYARCKKWDKKNKV